MLKFLKSVLGSIVTAVKDNPDVKRIVKRHPKLFSFLKRRTNPNTVFGLFMTIGFLISLYFLYLFFGLAYDLVGNNILIQSDLRIVNLLQIFRTPAFSKFSLFVTYFGKGIIIIWGVAAIGLILALRKRWVDLAALLASTAVGQIFVTIIKNIFDRSRPPLANALVKENSFGFPSGHSTVAVTFYGLLAYFVYRAAKKRWQKVITVFAATAIIFAIGFSRMYLGAHYPSDVLAGWALGAFWLSAVITAVEVRKGSKPATPSRPQLNNKKIQALTIVIIISWLAGTGYYFLKHPLQPLGVVESKVIVSRQDIPEKLFEKYPRTSEDISGKSMEPIDFIFIGKQSQLDSMFKSAGWEPTDKISLKSMFKATKATLTHSAYREAPGTPSFWNARPNDYSYDKPTPANKISEREHIHFWETPFELENGDPVWFATAHFDKAIILTGSYIPSHEIDPNVDAEREKLNQELIVTKQIDTEQKFQIVSPTLGQNQAGSKFFTDGNCYIIYIKK